jgi:hypothetical protein
MKLPKVRMLRQILYWMEERQRRMRLANAAVWVLRKQKRRLI